MPEVAEVRIMSDFVNYVVSNEPFYEIIEKSDVSKVKTELNPFSGGVFTLQAKSRGKEMMLHMELIGGNLNGASTKNLLVTLGMSGNWMYVRQDSESFEKVMKHAHLRLKSTKGNYLVLYDIRRFAKWKWVDNWSIGRGPCPLTEYEDFVSHVKKHIVTDKSSNCKINELLMNQSYFNGIGNYLRSETLFRAGINPFKQSNSLTEEELDNLLKIIYSCVRDSYTLGGGQLKEWHNPHGTEGKNFHEWMKCYGNKKMNKVKDSTGRTFWYDPKWEDECKKTYSM
jgi:endonuclease VIII-like 1